MLNVSGLANEDEQNSVQLDFFGKYLDLPLLKPFSTRTFFLIPLSSAIRSKFCPVAVNF